MYILTHKAKQKPVRVPMFDAAGNRTHHVAVGGPIVVQREGQEDEVIQEATQAELEVLYIDRGLTHLIQFVDDKAKKAKVE